jgi:hypothetical protein
MTLQFLLISAMPRVLEYTSYKRNNSDQIQTLSIRKLRDFYFLYHVAVNSGEVPCIGIK